MFTNATCTGSRMWPAVPISWCETSSQAFVEVYDIIHPYQFRDALRGLRTSPFYDRQAARCLLLQGAGSERPASFEANAELAQRLRSDGLPFPERDDWSSRFWSPISIAEAHWTRERVAMYDMTPLTRYEIAGAGAAAFLQRMSTNNVDKSVGSVTYTMLLDETGGIRSDITVARLDTRFQVAVNGPLDFDWFSRHLPDDVTTSRHHRRHLLCRRVGTAGPRPGCAAVPLRRLAPGFGYFRARPGLLGSVP